MIDVKHRALRALDELERIEQESGEKNTRHPAHVATGKANQGVSTSLPPWVVPSIRNSTITTLPATTPVMYPLGIPVKPTLVTPPGSMMAETGMKKSPPLTSVPSSRRTLRSRRPYLSRSSACGSASILVRAYHRKAWLSGQGRGGSRHKDRQKAHQELLREIYGCDIALFPAHLATLNLAARQISDEENFPLIRRGNFFEVAETLFQAGGVGVGAVLEDEGHGLEVLKLSDNSLCGSRELAVDVSRGRHLFIE